jgi:hypothetical protein
MNGDNRGRADCRGASLLQILFEYSTVIPPERALIRFLGDAGMARLARAEVRAADEIANLRVMHRSVRRWF